MPVRPLKPEGTLPTTSPDSYLRLFDYLGKAGVPDKIEPSVWHTLYKSSLASKVRAGLRWLGLIEGRENTTTPLLRSLVEPVDSSERRENLKQLITERYAAILTLAQNPTTDSDKLEAAIGREFGVTGETQGKARTAFVGLATYLAIPVSPLLTRATGATNTVADVSSAAPRVEQAQEGITVFQPTPIQTTRLSDVSDEGDPRAEFLAVVQVLARRIPLSRRWTRAQVDHFIKAVEANLVTLIDVEEEREVSSMNGRHDERMPAGNGDMRS